MQEATATLLSKSKCQKSYSATNAFIDGATALCLILYGTFDKQFLTLQRRGSSSSTKFKGLTS